jgi:Domain found in IF2B/IF5
MLTAMMLTNKFCVFGCGVINFYLILCEYDKPPLMPIADPTKYFGCELGAQTQFDAKNDRYIVNGAHDASKLQDLLDGFIRKFVLCPECENPETNLVSGYWLFGLSTGFQCFSVGRPNFGYKS